MKPAIFVIDDQDPEDNAMMQALYSRSPDSVVNHLEKVKKAGSGKFMDQYYVGYNHQSIGDCGTTTLYIEYVSMLAAKAIQDSPLYNGQEASTRYIDMSQQPILNPLGIREGLEIQDCWMKFYNLAMAPTIEHLKTTYPKQPDEDPKQYEKAIKARSFDILRGFLPAGCTTFVSWHGTLRHAADHLVALRHHQLMEVRLLASTLLSALQTKYPHSFNQKLYDKIEKYCEITSQLYDPASSPVYVECRSTLTNESLGIPEIQDRPSRARLPHYLDNLGQVDYKFLLDFGSFRDLQRHRNGVCRMPLLSTKWGFNQWYLDQLPSTLRSEAEALLETQKAAINNLPAPPVGGPQERRSGLCAQTTADPARTGHPPGIACGTRTCAA